MPDLGSVFGSCTLKGGPCDGRRVNNPTHYTNPVPSDFVVAEPEIADIQRPDWDGVLTVHYYVNAKWAGSASRKLRLLDRQIGGYFCPVRDAVHSIANNIAVTWRAD